MQEAVAVGLEQAGERKFFEDQLVAYTERRDVLTSYFDQIGLSYTRPDGAYFVLVDMSPIKVPEDFPTPESCKGRGKDFQLCWWIAQELKVASIPPSEVSKCGGGDRGISLMPVLLQGTRQHRREVCAIRLRTFLWQRPEGPS